MLIKPLFSLALTAAVGLFSLLALTRVRASQSKTHSKAMWMSIFYGEEAYFGAHEKHQRNRAGKPAPMAAAVMARLSARSLYLSMATRSASPLTMPAVRA